MIATAVGTVPSFELNRRWVWQRTGRRSMRGGAGAVLDPVVHRPRALHAHRDAGRGVGRLGRTVGLRGTAAIEAANVAAWGSLWVAQFVILDRFLFRTKTTTASAPVAASLTDEAA